MYNERQRGKWQLEEQSLQSIKWRHSDKEIKHEAGQDNWARPAPLSVVLVTTKGLVCVCVFDPPLQHSLVPVGELSAFL